MPSLDSAHVCPRSWLRHTAELGWHYSLPVPEGFDPASVPLVAGGLLVLAGRDGSVTAIDLVAQEATDRLPRRRSRQWPRPWRERSTQ